MKLSEPALPGSFFVIYTERGSFLKNLYRLPWENDYFILSPVEVYTEQRRSINSPKPSPSK